MPHLDLGKRSFMRSFLVTVEAACRSPSLVSDTALEQLHTQNSCIEYCMTCANTIYGQSEWDEAAHHVGMHHT